MTAQASLRYDTGQIHLVFGESFLLPGNAQHCLTVSFTTRATWLAEEPSTENALVLLVGAAWVEQTGGRWLGAVQPQTVVVRGYTVSEKLTIDLSDEQLIALERARGEQDIVLRLDVQATLLSPPEGVHARAEAQVSVRISGTRWLELLDQAGTEMGVLVRVRSPLTDPLLRSAANGEDAASLAQATIRLAQARAELRDLQWEHCVGTCRRVLEILGRLVDLPKPKVVFDVTPP